MSCFSLAGPQQGDAGCPGALRKAHVTVGRCGGSGVGAGLSLAVSAPTASRQSWE